MFVIGNPSKLRHGHARRGQVTPEFVAWQAMKRRCIDPNHKKFSYYGAKGVSVCPRWMNSFEDFLEDMGPKPSPSHSLDRYPNRHGDYEPENVRWATKAEQFANRDIARTVLIDGVNRPLADVCREKGLNLKAIRSRLNREWTIEKAFSLPIKSQPYYPRPNRRKLS